MQPRLIRLTVLIFTVFALSRGADSTHAQTTITYPIVDTNQTECYSAMNTIQCGMSFTGQDGDYVGLQPAYQDNGDGTVTDLNTGLMWLQDPGPKTTYADAVQTLQSYTFAGYDDWRLPTIKELYSLTLFSGLDPSGLQSSAVPDLEPFIDTDYFVFLYGDQIGGDRVIDSQWLTGTLYNSTVFNGTSCFFGFNFADGRIKCYPLDMPGGAGGYFALFVRGRTDYGVNDFADNGNATISDDATGLMWTKNDNGAGVDWQAALSYCNALSVGGHSNWRLPNIKELQSIVDYARSPDVTGSPAIDPIFNTTGVNNEAGNPDYPYFWSSTTHLSYNGPPASGAYIAFGRAIGSLDGGNTWIDVHGAGAQRSDPKTGNPDDYPVAFGPQGDARRVFNYVRCVRDDASQAVAPTITSPAPGNGFVDQSYSHTFTATGDTPITYAVTSGDLPDGLALSGATISGTPTNAGVSSGEITATNGIGTDVQTFSITILDTELPPRLYPADTQTLMGGTDYDWPRFTFEHFTGVDWYGVWIGRADYSTQNLYTWYEASQICDADVCTLPVDLWLTDGDYRWWMTYWGQNDQAFGTYWNETTFSVDFDAPSTFALTSPADGATVTSAPATIAWARDTDVLWYQIWVGPNTYATSQYFGWVDATDICDDTTCSIDVSDQTFADGDYEVWAEQWGPGGYATWPAVPSGTFTLDTTP